MRRVRRRRRGGRNSRRSSILCILYPASIINSNSLSSLVSVVHHADESLVEEIVNKLALILGGK